MSAICDCGHDLDEHDDAVGCLATVRDDYRWPSFCACTRYTWQGDE